MMGHTHLVLGLGAGLGVAVAVHASGLDAAALAGAAGLAALVPDIDHPRGTIRQRLGLVGHIGFFWLKHRGITHTLIALLVLTFAVLALPVPLPYVAALVAGYVSHLIADMMTLTGLPLFWPASDNSVHLLPRPLRIRTGSWVEQLLFIVVICGLALAVYGLPLVRF